MKSRHRVLIVDDSPLFRRAGELTFAEEADYELRFAESGEEALQTAHSFHPELVLLDIMLPGIDGYETCRRMRAEAKFAHTKIIMLSSKGKRDERLQGYDAGADDYLTKPCDYDELRAKVRVYLRLKSVEEVDQVKSRLIEVLRHSTRTPLTSIIAGADLLLSVDELSGDERTSLLQGVLNNAERLHRLLAKAEQLATMKSGEFDFDFQTGDLGRMIGRCIEELRPQFAATGVRCRWDHSRPVVAAFDDAQMAFVINALLDNAVRFSPPGGEVTIRLAECGSDITLTVSDHGEGITPDLLAGVFEEFANPDSALFNQGDGLSLAIAQEIVLAHHGSIELESSPGRGTTVSVRLPRPAGTSIANRKSKIANQINCSTISSSPLSSNVDLTT